jgi:hypothetical protein
VSKEKFELAFLAGGALLDVLGTRLRREPATPRESVGAAVHTLGQVMNEYASRLDDPEAARNRLLARAPALTGQEGVSPVVITFSNALLFPCQ